MLLFKHKKILLCKNTCLKQQKKKKFPKSYSKFETYVQIYQLSIEQLFAVLAGSIISKFIRPQWIFSCVENIGITGNSGNGCHGYTQR